MASSSEDVSSSTQPVVFTTQTTYLLPAHKFMIPTTWKRYQLSQLVNKALSLTAPVPFDFLVRGEILRGTLAEWCHEKGVGEVRCAEEGLRTPTRFRLMILLHAGGNVGSRVYRICNAASKNVIDTTRRLGLGYLLRAARVSSVARFICTPSLNPLPGTSLLRHTTVISEFSTTHRTRSSRVVCTMRQ